MRVYLTFGKVTVMETHLDALNKKNFQKLWELRAEQDEVKINNSADKLQQLLEKYPIPSTVDEWLEFPEVEYLDGVFSVDEKYCDRIQWGFCLNRPINEVKVEIYNEDTNECLGTYTPKYVLGTPPEQEDLVNFNFFRELHKKCQDGLVCATIDYDRCEVGASFDINGEFDISKLKIYVKKSIYLDDLITCVKYEDKILSDIYECGNGTYDSEFHVFTPDNNNEKSSVFDYHPKKRKKNNEKTITIELYGMKQKTLACIYSAENLAKCAGVSEKQVSKENDIIKLIRSGKIESDQLPQLPGGRLRKNDPFNPDQIPAKTELVQSAVDCCAIRIFENNNLLLDIDYYEEGDMDLGFNIFETMSDMMDDGDGDKLPQCKNLQDSTAKLKEIKKAQKEGCIYLLKLQPKKGKKSFSYDDYVLRWKYTFDIAGDFNIKKLTIKYETAIGLNPKYSKYLLRAIEYDGKEVVGFLDDDESICYNEAGMIFPCEPSYQVHPKWASPDGLNLGGNYYIGYGKKIKMILGTMPPLGEVDFYYGSSKNYFWKILSQVSKKSIDSINRDDIINDTSLSENTARKEFLRDNNLGIGDIYEGCMRIDPSSDEGIVKPEYNTQMMFPILGDSVQGIEITKVFCTSECAAKGFFNMLCDKSWLNKYVKRSFDFTKAIDSIAPNVCIKMPLINGEVLEIYVLYSPTQRVFNNSKIPLSEYLKNYAELFK